MKYNGGLRALWCAAKSAGGVLRIGPSVVEDYPGDKNIRVTIDRDKNFGDLIVTAHQQEADAQSD